jgi:4-carboxymuconolactone decarboxylase
MERPFRLPDVPIESYTPEQRRASDVLLKSMPTMGHLVGPLRVYIRDSRVFETVATMIEVETESVFLGKKLNRLVAIIVSRQWGAQFMWFAHVNHASHEGISPEVIEAIRLGRKPTLTKEDEQVVYEVAAELNDKRSLSDAAFGKARKVLGDEGVRELITHIGFYTSVAITVSALKIVPPEPLPANPLP